MKPDGARPRDWPGLKALQVACYPTWPEKVGPWYAAHPTLVIRAGKTIIGATSFSLSFPPQMIPHAGELCYGHGVAVHPDHRGRGLGWLLADARHQAAREGGASFFIGMTWASNHGMIRIFERQGLKPFQTIIDAYPWHEGDDKNGMLYTGGL